MRALRQASSKRKARSHASGEGLAKQAATFDKLRERMSDLQQQIEHLAGDWIAGIGVFQFVSPVFLHIETFILDLPA